MKNWICLKQNDQQRQFNLLPVDIPTAVPTNVSFFHDTCEAYSQPLPTKKTP